MKRFISILLALCIFLPQGTAAFAGEIPLLEGEESVGQTEFCCGTDPELLSGLQRALLERKSTEVQQGLGISTFSSQVPHWSLDHIMPSTGNVKMLVLPVTFPDFADARDSYDAQRLEDVFFAEYDPDKLMERQSVRGIYFWNSYGKMDLTGTVLPLYEAPEPSTYYDDKASQLQEVYREAIQYYIDHENLNLADYDSDGDGYVDGLTVVPVGPRSKLSLDNWTALIWGMNGDFNGADTKIERFSHVNINLILATKDINYDRAETPAHEMGHLLGLEDNYDFTGIQNVIDYALHDVMSGSDPYFNVYYKWLFGWIDPVILTNEDTLPDFVFNDFYKSDLYAVESFPGNVETEPKAMVLIPEPELLPFTEFYMVEYRAGIHMSNTTNNYFEETPGVVIWHCNTALNESGDSYTNYKSYLQPVRKSGVPAGEHAYSASDIYVEGDEFASDSKPVNSDFYSGYTGAYMKVLEITPEKAVIRAGFRRPDLTPPPTIEFSEFFPKAIRSGGGRIKIGTVAFKSNGELIPEEDIDYLRYSKYEQVNVTGDVIGGRVKANMAPKVVGNPREVSAFVSSDCGEGTMSLTYKAGAIAYNGKNSREVTSPVLYVDNTPPEIMLKGKDTQYLRPGAAYTELGADITDNMDPDIAGKLQIDSSAVDTSQIGTYTVTYSAEDWAGNRTETTRTVIVKEPSPPTVLTPPAAKSLTYTGSAQELVTPGTAEGGTMEYSLSETGEYSADVPTGTDAGEYTVWYKVLGGEGHTDLAPASVTAAIQKAVRPAEIPGDVNVPHGTELSSIALPDGWSWKNPSQTLSTGANQVTVSYSDTRNYAQTEFVITVTMAEPVHVHTLKKAEAKPATCTAEGHLEYWTCTDCGSIFADETAATLTTAEERTLAKLGHAYEAVVTAPTCTEQGFTTHTCSNCGDSYKDSYTSASGHTPGGSATCTEDQICTVCKTVLKRKFGHAYKAEVTAPTCTAQGFTTHTCSNCGDSYKDSYTNASGHTPGDPATCTEDQTCTVCNAVLKQKSGHAYKAAVTTPTCTKQGFTTYTCSNCGDSYKDAYTNAAGHVFGEWVQTKAPTTETAGEKRRDCTKCDAFETAVSTASAYAVSILSVSPAAKKAALSLTAPGDCSVIAAVYDENGCMTGVDVAAVPAGTANMSLSLSGEWPENYTVKAFLVDGRTAPLCKNAVYKYAPAADYVQTRVSRDHLRGAKSSFQRGERHAGRLPSGGDHVGSLSR